MTSLPDIDPAMSLAFGMNAIPGAYALLLGSGVSRSAEIPTGWDITLDLVRQLRAAGGEDGEGDDESWYQNRYDSQPDYSDILEALTNSSAERQGLLKAYFEPTEEDLEEGTKVPQAAHRAIASLVVSGHVRVILTTNFDRLIEKAIEDAGVTPNVISTADQLEGALPLVHSGCTVIKLHGDYMDTRIRNTVQELEKYDPRMDALLDRVLDEYGLIVSGWSAEYDIALRVAIERTTNRRFSWIWSTRSEPGDYAKALIAHRSATIVTVAGADPFFSELQQRVETISDLRSTSPQSKAVQVGMLKRLLRDDSGRIQREELIVSEVARLIQQLGRDGFPVDSATAPIDAETFTRRITHYESLTETLRALMETLGRYGGASDSVIVASALQRLLAPRGNWAGTLIWLELEYYPAFLIWYAADLGATARENFSFLRPLMDLRFSYQNEETTVATGLTTWVLPWRDGWSAFFEKKLRQPESNHLFDVFSRSAIDPGARSSDFAGLFDRWEYYLSLQLVHAATTIDDASTEYIPTGRYLLGRWGDPSKDVTKIVAKESDRERNAWPPIAGGLFGGSYERFSQIETAAVEWMSKQPRFLS